jgi:hypothetical protein
MPLTSRRVSSPIRRTVRRVLRPLLARRHGYLFISRRVVLDRLNRSVRKQPVPPQLELVPFDSLPGRGALVDEIYPRQQIVFDPLPGLDPWLDGVPGWGIEHRIPPQRVVQLSDGVVFGREGWVGPTPDAICTDLGNSVPRSAMQAAHAAERALNYGVVDLEGTTVSLLQLSGGSYFHWMMQGLPRLSLVIDSVGVSEIDRFLVGPQPAPFVLETLDRIGIRQERLLRVAGPVPAYRSERLVAATMLPVGAPPPSWATRFVRGLFGDSLGDATHSLLYVGRGAGRRRRLVNEDRVLEVLEPFGFCPVVMDGRTVAEQAALFAGARCVVAPHGAALTNALFAPRSITVLELLSANAPSAVFAVLARQTRLGYKVLVGSEARPPRPLRTWIGDADLVVDNERLAAIIPSLLTSGPDATLSTHPSARRLLEQ